MKFRNVAITGLLAAAVLGFSSQAQAMNMLAALGNPQIQITLSSQGTVQVVQKDETRTVEVSQLEPAAGAQDRAEAK